MELYKYIYKCGVWYRNNKITQCYNFLKDSERWGRDRLYEHQLVALCRLISMAYEHSPYYRNKFDKYGVKPSDIKSLDDLKLFPCSSKQEVLDNVKSIQSFHLKEKHYFSETSGSTGRPLVFYRNQSWDAWHNASVMRGYSWHDVQPWERNGYLWGYNIARSKQLKVKLLDILQNRFRLFSYKDDDVKEFLSKLESAHYLAGYSSMIYEIAKKVNAAGTASRYKLKMVKGTSEKIFDVYRREVEQAFGTKIVSEYGSAEGGILAFECCHGNMHLNMETALVEVVDDEIVVTNLVSDSFPIIRYKLGDYIKLNSEKICECGMAHPIVEEVTGRVGQLIYGKHDTYPSLTLYYVFKNLALNKNLILNYQVVQNAAGSIECYIESLLNSSEHKLLSDEFKKYFNNDLDIIITDGHQRSNFIAKKKDFISNVK